MSGLRAIPLGLPLARLHHTSVTSLKDDDTDHAPLSQPQLVLGAKTKRHSQSSLKNVKVHMQKEFSLPSELSRLLQKQSDSSQPRG